MNFGIIGIQRGNLLLEYSRINPEVNIIAICDINQDLLNTINLPVYQTTDYKDFLKVQNLNAIYIATPPEPHAEISAFFLKHHISVLCEIPACLNENEAQLLRESIQNSHAIYMMAENYCYIPENQAIKKIIQSGKLGEIVFVEGKYIHDCKDLLLQNGELTWRGLWNTVLKLNHYPTHSLGPICWWLDIGSNKTDSIISIQNHSSSPFSLEEYWQKMKVFQTPTQGDMVFSILKTKQNITIHLRYDTKSNRPYLKNGYEIQGTLGWIQSGRFDEEEPIIYLKEDKKNVPLREMKEYKEVIESMPYKNSQFDKKAVNYVLFYEFIKAIQNKKSPISLEDSILWSSPIWS